MSKSLTICAIGDATSVHVRNRTQCFAERGHMVYIISPVPATLEGVTVLVPQITGINPLLTPIKPFLWYREIVRLLKQCQPDIIHIHYAYSPWAWLASATTYRPLVVTLMGSDAQFDADSHQTKIGTWLTLQTLKQAQWITAKSDEIAENIAQFGNFKAKTARIYWGVDMRVFQPMSGESLHQSLNIPADDLVIFSPKILRPLYNIHLLVEALPHILKTHPNTRLLITTYRDDADYYQQVLDTIARLKLESYITLVESIPHAQMPAYYGLADLIVALPPYDGMPQALFEAMACGVPNVLSRLNTYESVVTHGESAYFVDIDVNSIAEGVIALLSDQSLRETISQNGLKIVREVADFQAEVTRVEAKYHELLTMLKTTPSLPSRLRIMLGVWWERMSALLPI